MHEIRVPVDLKPVDLKDVSVGNPSLTGNELAGEPVFRSMPAIFFNFDFNV
ncbi:MAG: hypothetical protein P1V19_02310 [Gimesia sp.]|nr:hypothetical protein [Gimesia sp.]